jgi:EAL domain-containing protein (putative c-di-GMP-specific phosphodiesterase class I)
MSALLRTLDPLAGALRHRELHLEYQPQVTMRGEVTGFEALVRWTRPGGATLLPADFLPRLHRLGLAAQLTEFVLEQACIDMAAWRDAGGAVPRVAINLTELDLDRDDLAALVLNRLAEHRLATDRLTLEVTENVMARTDAGSWHQLALLRTRGVRIAMDDFGTGWSSLARLVELPLDVLKIDRTFLANVPGDVRREHVLRHVVRLAADLDLDVLAEGVERPAQLAWLAMAGVERFQGHLFHEAAPPAQWIHVLRRARRPLRGWEATELAPLDLAVR